jgi:hypothetical protein
MASATVVFPTLALAAAIATEYARNDPTNKEQGAGQLKDVRFRAFYRGLRAGHYANARA